MSKTNQRPSPEKLKGMLLDGDFRARKADQPLPITDPLATHPITLDLSQIRVYEKNPRQVVNRNYAEIKESIRNTKHLITPLSVTRPPGDDLYLLSAGGKSRYTMLTELFEETGDTAFNPVQCWFVPWTSESFVLGAHLIENDLRAPNLLIEKAYAVEELQRMLEAEQRRKLSHAEFVRLAQEIGYAISRRSLSRFEFARHLDQMIPQVLRTGLGAHQIDNIKRIHEAYRRFCKERDGFDLHRFEALFMHVMSQHDGDGWVIDLVRKELDRQLSELIHVRANLLTLQIDALIQKHALKSSPSLTETNLPSLPPDNDSLSANSGYEGTDPHTSGDERPSQTGARVAKPFPEDLEDPATTTIGAPGNFDHDSSGNDQQPAIADTSTDHTKTPSNRKSAPDLKALRARGHDLARAIAQAFDLQPAILPSHAGMGFIVDSPDKPWPDRSIQAIWWLLVGISEQTCVTSRMAIWKHTTLYQRYLDCKEKGDGSLTEWLGTPPDVQQFMYEILHNSDIVDDRVFNHYCRLIETCRTIRQQFPDTEIWPDT